MNHHECLAMTACNVIPAFRVLLLWWPTCWSQASFWRGWGDPSERWPSSSRNTRASTDTSTPASSPTGDMQTFIAESYSIHFVVTRLVHINFIFTLQWWSSLVRRLLFTMEISERNRQFTLLSRNWWELPQHLSHYHIYYGLQMLEWFTEL